MRRSFALTMGAVVLGGAWLSLAAPGAAEERPDAAEEARATWERSCRPCHAVPDATFETDRAFLRQITETS